MSLTLTVLLSLLSAGILAGRVYEILNLTDAFTGFLIVNGVVMNPYVIGLFVVITLCCGILIFGSGKAAVPYYSKSSKVTCILAGVGFVAAAVPAMQFEVTAPFFIAGGAALIIMGITGLGKKKTDIAVMLLMLGFAAGMCMDVVSFDVNTYHNTVFVQNVMEYLCIIAFMLTVVKNVYLPSKYSRMFLYVTGMLSFSVCSMMNVADIINLKISIPCTSCRYCTEGCPMNIPIPDYFELYNAEMQEIEKNFTVQGTYYDNLILKYGKASDCVSCGQCTEHCPQHLDIPGYLKKVAKVFED